MEQTTPTPTPSPERINLHHLHISPCRMNTLKYDVEAETPILEIRMDMFGQGRGEDILQRGSGKLNREIDNETGGKVIAGEG